MNYLLGVSYHIQQQGKKIGGVDLVIDGDIPVGAGMSSSAALCSAYGFALNELFQLGLEPYGSGIYWSKNRTYVRWC